VEVGLLGVAMVPPAPDTMLHAPVPTVGELAAKIKEVAQTTLSAPAAATVGLALRVMTTSSVEAVHGALEIVHRRV